MVAATRLLRGEGHGADRHGGAGPLLVDMAGADSAVRARVLVAGRVQGVAYRAFARDVACRAGLRGGVRNLDDGRVEVEVEGERRAVEGFLDALRAGPPLASVDRLDVQWQAATGAQTDFRVWY